MDIFAKITNFFKEVKLEMKKINWLSRQETLKYTLIVLGVAIAVAIFLGTLDVLFNRFLNKFIL